MNPFGNSAGMVYRRQNYVSIPEPKTAARPAKSSPQKVDTSFSTNFTDRTILQRLAIRVVNFPAKARADLIAQVGTPSERLPLADSPQVNYQAVGRETPDA